MELSSHILSQITTFLKYSKYLEDKQRRETWSETIDRNMQMHIKKFPKLKLDIEEAYKLVHDKEILPSMRALQFGGKPIEISPNRSYNCSYAPIDSWEIFHEIMFLLLGGSGFGYSVQKHHVDKLPIIKKPTKKTKRYLINDSIEGWSDAVKVLMNAYFFAGSDPVFDFSDIRKKGALLKTSGGKAPGPQPLKDCIHNIRKILDAKESGDKLTPLEAHDIVCFIANAVLSGGIRRSALIALFSLDDEDMLTCKFGNWYELNPQRARANNSAVVLRHKIKKKKFNELWEKIKASGSGEPGIFFSNTTEMGLNPCAEVSLRANQFCNLVTLNGSNVKSQAELEKRAKAATFIATLQASYTDFHYLRDIWRDTTEAEALIGVSITGIASGSVLKLDLSRAAKAVKAENKRVAKLIGINPAARCTVIKPEGTASLVLGTSSGIHAWHDFYYIRRITINKTEAIYEYLLAKLPDLVEDDFFKPDQDAKILIPIKAPDGSIFRTESALDMLERVKHVYLNWIKPGHRKGQNTNNVSATITIKPDEWDSVREWMWRNKKYYNSLSVLPYDGGNYVQTPFTSCTKEEYEAMLPKLKEIHLNKIKELTDDTSVKESDACAGGNCEIK